eukprot:6192773-Pleurochrysis_carterae.AAC.1
MGNFESEIRVGRSRQGKSFGGAGGIWNGMKFYGESGIKLRRDKSVVGKAGSNYTKTKSIVGG